MNEPRLSMNGLIRARCEDVLPTEVAQAAQIVGMDKNDFMRFVLKTTSEIVQKKGKSAFFQLYASI